MPQGYDRLRLPSSLESLGTTAPALKSLGIPTLQAGSVPGASAEWMADLEYVWRSRVTTAIAGLDERARVRRRQAETLARMMGDHEGGLEPYRVMCLRSAEWAQDRARALAMARADVITSCGQRWRAVKCGCTTVELKVGCDQPQLCGECRRRHWQKWRKRITLSMDHALTDERARWRRAPSTSRKGMLPGIYLITLTAPHTGDLVTDRGRMGDAVRKLLKHANKYGWWRTYALTWEATAGRDGKGHMHAHLAVISSWIPYGASESGHMSARDVPLEWLRAHADPALGERVPVLSRKQAVRGLHEVWRDAMPGALVLDVQAPRTGGDQAAIGAQYLAKYVTKGIEPIDFTGRKAGELLVAFRSKRKVTTSAGFWQRLPPECAHCKQLWQSLGAPVSLQKLMPGAVIRSMAERMCYHIPRGQPQVDLRWEGG